MNKIKEFLIRLSSFWLFYRWHPEVALRYLPIVDEIKKMRNDVRILEVGSGGLGITPYLRKKVTGVDVEFKPPFHPLLHKIEATATKLPFKSDSFDVVISTDMLEHLEKKDREKAIFEMVRIARKKVFIGVPVGRTALEQDRKLDEYYQKRFGERFLFLEEQISFGLPEKEEIHDIIEGAGIAHQKELRIKIIGNENLHLREFLMKGWITKNFFMDVFYRKIILLFLPFMRYFNKEPSYRQIFFVDIL